MKIIVIQGFIGSGKDTLADILLNKYKGVKLSFASTLKDIVSIIFNWNRNLLEGSTKESREWREQVDEWWSKRLNIPNLTPRWVLQHLGTDVFRNKFHNDIWIASLENKIQNLSKDLEMIVITDCRFSNEIECLRTMSQNLNNKVVFIKITNNKTPKDINGNTEWVKNYIENDIIPQGIHQSEYMWLKNSFDYEIQNTGTIEQLKNSINTICDL